MNRLPRIVVVGLSLSSGVLSLLGAEIQPQPKGKILPAVVISTTGSKDFTIPLDKSKHIWGTVPVGKGSVVAVRLLPKLENGQAAVDVLALLGDTANDGEKPTCAEAKAWKRQVSLGTYRLAANDPIALTELERYGAPSMTVKFERAFFLQSCLCNCNPACCNPFPGKCMGCGDCGQCCYIQ